ncbi:hypothetical protein J437_LFUL014492 [Ladona fulva]|uniref:Beta-1,4-glucuronyltransferase 1 n=1 Tax=Ladona fulva TaxID=123851 RepID=A0A8K0P6H8_LADFU|nr:hypothetical protein J437_LFUL014492 [Ladona fulva]
MEIQNTEGAQKTDLLDLMTLFYLYEMRITLKIRPTIESSLPDGKKYDCSVDPEKFINELLPTIGMSTEGTNETVNVYPQNILRNSAIRMCPTEWIMTVDADMMPQPSLVQRLQSFLALKENNNCSNCAFVLPTYEVKIPNDTAMVNRLPDTKEVLLGLIKNGSARHFHIRIFQAYEMFLAGYQFKLLDNAFLVHWGFQEMKSRPAWRLKQTVANYDLFKNWLLEKTIRYDSDPLNLTHKIVKNQEKRIFRVIMDKK